MTRQEENKRNDMEITIEDITNKVKELLDTHRKVEKWTTPVFESNEEGGLTSKGHLTTYVVKDLIVDTLTYKSPHIKVTADGMEVGSYSKTSSGVKELIELLEKGYENDRVHFDFFKKNVRDMQKTEIKRYFGKDYSYDDLGED